MLVAEELGPLLVAQIAGDEGALFAAALVDQAKELVDVLARAGIVTSERDGNLRISAHCYNTREDADAVLGELRRHRELLA